MAEATAQKAEPQAFYDRWLLDLINDPRDLPFVHLIAQCLVLAGLGVGLFFITEHFWWFAVGYWLLVGLTTLDKFILMLHCTSHRMLFKKKYAALNKLIPVWISPFFGETPWTYFVHHMGMHHPENNLPDDLSTTMPFQRDRLTHWLMYFGRFMTIGIFELGQYHRRKGNSRMLSKMVLGELTFLLGCAVLAWFNWRATVAVFIGPMVVVRLLMMAGNWGQHAFIKHDDPANAYANSITCINTRYNRRCFNDGYHIHHHVKARCHWTEYPGEFETNKEEYGRQDAIVFDGIDFFQVWLLLVTGRYKSLAKRFVHLPGAPERDEAAIIELLKERTRRFSADELRRYSNA